jgi:hypothetical protein
MRFRQITILPLLVWSCSTLSADDLIGKYKHLADAVQCRAQAVFVDFEPRILYSLYNRRADTVQVPIDLFEEAGLFTSFTQDGERIPCAAGFPPSEEDLRSFVVVLPPRTRVDLVGRLPTCKVTVGTADDGDYTFRHLIFGDVKVEFTVKNGRCKPSPEHEKGSGKTTK